MSAIYNVIKRPIITEKGLTLKENDRTLCFEVDENASKTQIQEAVERLFKVNAMRRGIMYADAVSVVSPTYAKEIMTAALPGDKVVA